jgi:hypothetical protein
MLRYVGMVWDVVIPFWCNFLLGTHLQIASISNPVANNLGNAACTVTKTDQTMAPLIEVKD